MPISAHLSTQEGHLKAADLIAPTLHYQKIFSNDNVQHPSHCAIFTVKEGEPSFWVYPCNEFIVCLEGELTLKEEDNPGELILLKPGDVARITKGTKMKWGTTKGGKGFSVAEVPKSDDITDYLEPGYHESVAAILHEAGKVASSITPGV